MLERTGSLIRTIPDWPTPGVMFKDITPALADAEALFDLVESLAEPFMDTEITHVVAMEARGFILGAPVAIMLDAGFIPLRKPGKLPHQTFTESYTLEYGLNELQMHVDALASDARVLIVDDVLATGGTASAAERLIAAAGATVVASTYVLELAFLGGRAKLSSPAHSLIVID
jgi:adenine phosphoribosyltransferase